ncbi:sensor domain-containing protein [Deinococcus lacus]|uniref:Sensor domain-containing protein n=1 Tax=Deinococcus lacus TaxID=392561 RepID=A0ABW1YE12_9DEIO
MNPLPAPQKSVPWPALTGPLWADLLDSGTYLTAVYLLLAPALGLGGLALLVMGLSAGILTLPLLMGAGVLVGTLWLLVLLTHWQRALCRRLLGVRYGPAVTPRFQGLADWATYHLRSGVTYRSLLFLCLQFPLATLCLTAVLVPLLFSVLGLIAPWWGHTGAVTVGSQAVQLSGVQQVAFMVGEPAGCCSRLGCCN